MRQLRTIGAILRDGFPDSYPEVEPLSPEAFMASVVHDAVHSGDPLHRTKAREWATRCLLDGGGELPLSLREWLAFVLARLDDVPHMHVGRSPDATSAVQFWLALAEYEFHYMSRRPKPMRKQLTIDAAKHFGVSVPTIKRALSSPDYRHIREWRWPDQKRPPT